jgi:4-hydroxybenzoate polyprenyltransferase
VVTAVLALLAGGSSAVALRLALAMTALQFAIGAVNDIADTSRDRGRKRGKPLPRGLLSRRVAILVAACLIAVGLWLSAPSGPAAVAVAVLGLGVGLAYDLRLKGTIWSWLPFAVGIPLLPLYAWLGASAALPASFAILLPTAVAAGAGLAIANLLADLERDEAAGADTVATRLGARRAWAVSAVLLAGVAAVAVATAIAVGGGGGGLGALVLGGGVVAVGSLLGRSTGAAGRERGWELAALGVGLLAVGWVAAMAEAGAL